MGNGVTLSCPNCNRGWPVGAGVGEFERQVLEAVPCPACGSHTLRCVIRTGDRPNFRPRPPRLVPGSGT
jgi:Zn finger protein HypA/HybF involved in hydrogenase expression